MKRRQSTRRRRGRATNRARKQTVFGLSAVCSVRDIVVLSAALLIAIGGVIFARTYAVELQILATILPSVLLVVVVGASVGYGYRFVRAGTDIVTRGVDSFVRIRPYQVAGLRQLQAVPGVDFVRFVLLLFEQQGFRIRSAKEVSGLITAYLEQGSTKRALAIFEDAHLRAITQWEVAALSGVCEAGPAVLVTLGNATPDARTWARAHNIEIIDGAAFMNMVWRTSRRQARVGPYSIVRALTSSALSIPERAVPTPIAREYQRVVAGWEANTKVNTPKEGCAKFWPELCAR